MYKIIWGFLLLVLLGTGVYQQLSRDTYVPKPLGHPRIVLPPHTYKPLQGHFPYTFEVSQHATVTKYTCPNAEPYWINIRYPAFDAEVQLTYKSVKRNMNLLRKYFTDAYRLAAKHQIKASSIQEKRLRTSQGYSAILVELCGEVPSQVQFYTSDMNNHFLRGALYFNTATQNDYLAPIIAFIRADIIHLIQTLNWNNE